MMNSVIFKQRINKELNTKLMNLEELLFAFDFSKPGNNNKFLPIARTKHKFIIYSTSHLKIK